MSWLRDLLGGKPKPRLVPVASVQLPPREPVQLYGDQLARKRFMEDLLRGEGVPVNEHLPVIESEAEVTLRSHAEVAERLQILALVAARAEGVAQDTVNGILAERGLAAKASPNERAFLAHPDPSEHDRIQSIWRYEAAWVMFWALGWGEATLGMPRAICDVPLLAATVRDTVDYSDRPLRSANDILNEADLIYRCHWAVRQSDLDGTPVPGGFERGVVLERHYALNWLVGYAGAEWDDVSTDT